MRALNFRTKDQGVIQIIGKGKNACVCFHTGRRPEYNSIDNSPALRKFILRAAKRLEIPKPRPCAFCQGDKVLMASTGDPKHPLKTVPCPNCQKKRKR